MQLNFDWQQKSNLQLNWNLTLLLYNNHLNTEEFPNCIQKYIYKIEITSKYLFRNTISYVVYLFC